MTSDRPRGRIITFYSYKGGTGRSMALANAAWILASNGKEVLAVDWDLEAPGLHRYFQPFLPDPELAKTPGLLDVVWEADAAARGASGAGAGEAPPDVLANATPLRRHFPGWGALHLLGAGRQDESYSTRVRCFNWTDFYEQLEGSAFVDSLRARMQREYDYVLIDSRTGLSDVSGICTVQMPDVLVVAFTYNRQSTLGAAAVARSVRRQRPQLRILPVPMRVEPGEQDMLTRVRDEAHTQFDTLLTDVEDPQAYWRDIEIPYSPLFAYDELLAPIANPPGYAGTVLAQTERLVSYLTDGAVSRAVPIPEAERRALWRMLQRPAAQPGEKVVVLHTVQDRAWADWLAWHLAGHGYPVELVDLAAPVDRATVASAAGVVALVSAEGAAALSRLPSPSTPPPLLAVVVDAVEVPATLWPARVLDLTDCDTPRAVRGLDEVLDVLPRAASSAHGPGPRGPAPSIPRFPAPWNVPESGVGFTGRDELLTAIAGRLGRAPVLLAGRSGAGKTALAHEYARRHALEYDTVWWVDAAADVDEQLERLRLRLAADDLLQALRGSHHWLLVFDDARNPAAITADWTGMPGHVLLTSADPPRDTTPDGAVTLEIAGMARGESIDLLRRNNPAITGDRAARYAEQLDDLPLALVLAATAGPLDGPRGRSVDDSVGAVVRRVLDGLPVPAADHTKRVPMSAAGLAELMSMLAPAPVWPDMFIGTPGVDQAVDALVRARLATRWADRFRIHPLVRSVVREALPATSRRERTEEAEELLAAAPDPGRPDVPAHWPAYSRLLPHVEAVETLTGMPIRRRVVDTCWYLYHRGDPDRCRALARTAAARIRDDQVLRPADRDAASSAVDDQDGPVLLDYDHLDAITSWRLADFHRAREVSDEVGAARTRDLGRDAPATLRSRNISALSRAGLGEAAQALASLVSTLHASERALGAHHPDSLALLGNIAVVELQLGQPRHALKTADRHAGLCRTVFGTDWPRTLAGLHNVAVALAACGRYGEAVDLHRRVVAERRRVLGRWHPDVGNSLYGQAGALLARASDADVRVLITEATEIGRRRHSRDRPVDLRAAEVSAGPLTAGMLRARGLGAAEATPT